MKIIVFLKRYIQHQKNSFVSTKDGASWIMGYYIILLVFSITLIMYSKYRLDIIVTQTQDNLTSSTLGIMLPDFREIAFNQDFVLENCEDKIDLLIDLIAKNSNLKRRGSGLDARLYGDSDYYDTNYSDVIVEEVIFYNYHKSKGTVEVLTYVTEGTNLDWVSTETISDVDDTNIKDKVQTPQGERVEATSVFVKLTYPIKVCGIDHITSKGQLVSISQ